MVGVTSATLSRAIMRSTSSATSASAWSASFMRSRRLALTTSCRSSISYRKTLSSSLTAGSILRGTAISIRNIGRLRRAAITRCMSSLRRM